MSGSQDEIPPPPPPLPLSSQKPTQQTPHTVSTIKLPILKKGEYDIWDMKMEHYLAHTDYLIWDVIQNRNGPVSITIDTQGQIKVLPPRTVEEIVARERERKARTTLLMALPEDHLARFHNISDAKEMWDAIKIRFGRNAENKENWKRSGKQEDSKALVTIDGEGVDWTSHSEKDEDYALMACNSSESDTECASIGNKAYIQGLKKVSEPVVNDSNVECEPKVWSNAPIIEEYESDSEDKYVSILTKEHETPSFANKQVKTPRANVKNPSTHSQKPKVDKKELGYGFTVRALSTASELGGGLACLIAKATIDESNKWHRRLGHVNFKNINKLVKGNLVRGLLSKIFQNDHTCVACQNGKATQGLYVNNGTGIQDRCLFEVCGSKGIKREYSNARTPQQNRVAERKNMTLTEAARTMLVDSFLPNTFWAEAVSTACYVLNMIRDQLNNHAGPQEATNNAELERLKRQEKEANEEAKALRKKFAQDTENLVIQAGAARASNTNIFSTVSTPAKASSTNLVNTVSTPVSTTSSHERLTLSDPTNPVQDDSEIPPLEDIYQNSPDGICTSSSYNDEGAMADFTNLETVVNVSPIPTSRIHSSYPSTLILGDPTSAVQTRSKVNKRSKSYAFVSYVQKQRRNNHKDFQHCLFSCFLSQNEPKKISEALEDESWVDAMQEEFLQLEAIRIFLAFASYIGFIVYQMDVKSAFLYGKIDEEVYVSQPPGFLDPKYPQKVYKVVKALYGLHQAPRACQDKYVAEILKKFDFANVKTASTPIETQKPLVKDEEASDVDVHLYRSMIGSLMYLTASRPDIMFAVCACSRFQVTPKSSHLSAVKRIFRRLIFWQCKKQTIVATSTTEAEYVAATSCYGQVLWIQNQLLDYGFNFMNTKIYIDNESTICIVKNPVYHSKTKHIAIRHHFIRDAYEKKLIQVLKIHTDDNVANLLTKAFDVSRFQFLVVSIGMINP
ncbi:putative ribonuclease H-like domain-containing protein [Tanacetum coccineum]|uniref:Ribonuclease H-like domain-containing protein n=1 Tax=Tanacetum coccineum TaxID=301880 RepID=A0ABQ5IZ67_9ASTR